MVEMESEEKQIIQTHWNKYVLHNNIEESHDHDWSAHLPIIMQYTQLRLDFNLCIYLSFKVFTFKDYYGQWLKPAGWRFLNEVPLEHFNLNLT